MILYTIFNISQTGSCRLTPSFIGSRQSWNTVRMQYRGNISTRFSGNFEVPASEFQENLEEMFQRTNFN